MINKAYSISIYKLHAFILSVVTSVNKTSAGTCMTFLTCGWTDKPTKKSSKMLQL